MQKFLKIFSMPLFRISLDLKNYCSKPILSTPIYLVCSIYKKTNFIDFNKTDQFLYYSVLKISHFRKFHRFI